MSKLAKDCSPLPSEYLNVLRLTQEQHNIEIQPLEELAGPAVGSSDPRRQIQLHHSLGDVISINGLLQADHQYGMDQDS